MMLPEAELEKFMARKAKNSRRTHIRVEGRFNQRYALLCCDYLRSHNGAAAYAEIKRQLARYFPENVETYYDIKDPVFDIIIAGANDWAGVTDWHPVPTDA